MNAGASAHVAKRDADRHVKLVVLLVEPPVEEARVQRAMRKVEERVVYEHKDALLQECHRCARQRHVDGADTAAQENWREDDDQDRIDDQRAQGAVDGRLPDELGRRCLARLHLGAVSEALAQDVRGGDEDDHRQLQRQPRQQHELAVRLEEVGRGGCVERRIRHTVRVRASKQLRHHQAARGLCLL